MSNTVKIKNRKKKEVKINFRLLAIIFGIFVALILIGSIWATFHWGEGFGTIGVSPETPDDAAAGMTDIASEYATDDMMVLTPEELEEMGITMDDDGTAEVEDAEAADGEAAEEAGEAGEADAEAAEEAGEAAAEDTEAAENAAEDQ